MFMCHLYKCQLGILNISRMTKTMTTPEGELSKPPHYTAYLVRLWQESVHAPWRASAQSASSGEKIMFANLEELFAFLSDQTRAEHHHEKIKHQAKPGE